MASSSSSGNMALSRANGSKYDVFLSFRGEDTRHAFTDHLYNALKQAGILTFRDSDDAERGEELKEEIEKAIKASDASIIVLSENYATSTWCLDELSLILDQRRDCNHFVLPLFYHVDPSHVGKQEGSFKIAASSSRRRWTDDNVKRWKAALTEVVSVIGMPLFGSENKFIKEVVDTIYNRLDRKQIYLPHNITGMDARYAEITSWLDQNEKQFLVIYGMAGSGKSTLARYIIDSNCQYFECYSIVESIDSRCQKPYKMVLLQQQLCDDISKGKNTRIPSLCQGTSRIEVLLEKTKALILLDDIVKVGQLDDLLGRATISKESKIIITTHNEIICDWFMSKSKRFQKYRMRLLNDDESLELLSLHAFQSKIPKDGYNELAQQVVRYCDGSPLALEVLGSSLFHINNITSWESELSSYEKSFDDKINEVFIKSYDSIPSIPEKELFLHIACFFVGKDMNYVVKILKPDYPAESKIETLIKRCFLYVTPDKKLMMHRLLQKMGRYLADRESRTVVERTRVWRNTDSYHMLRRKKSSNTIEGLALDIPLLKEKDKIEPKELTTDSLQQMDQLKYLRFNYVKLTGSYEDFSEHIRWLCWVGFDKSTVHADILTRSIVALDMSYSCLEKFEPPTVMPSLKILNLKDSCNLLEIRSMNKIPNLETLIIWNCRNLFHICRGVGDLEWLSVLIMTGCKKLFKRERIKTSVELETSTSGGERANELSFPLPHSLQRVLLNECNLECTDYFPLSFTDQFYLQYINLGNSLFESLPSYNHLKDLRVLDLRKCSSLKRLVRLPSTLAELYIYDCTSIEKISFESGRFTLQEFGYEGCINLSEIEGLAKLLLVAKLDETDLGHLIWLKEYHNHEVCLIGDYQLTKGRSCRLQMLYEFNIMSTSLPDIMHPNLRPDYRSQSTSLSFEVPACPRSSRLKGLNVTFRYTISGDDWVWFAKLSTTNGVDLMYSPIVFGKPGIGQVGIWLSYWPIGNLLDVGDEVKVSIAVMSGLEILECGASLVYTDDNVAPAILKNKTGWVETFGRDLSGFHLIKGLYYLCQRDIYKIMEIGRLTSGWLSILVGDTIDDTEVRGWRMTGRPQQSYQLFTELKTGRYVIRGHEMEETGKFVDKIMTLEAATLTDRMKSATKFVSTDTETKVNKLEHLRIGLTDIQLATNNFSKKFELWSDDHYGVYKGYLEWFDREYVSSLEGKNKAELPKRYYNVRIMRINNAAAVDLFCKEIEILSTCKHDNIDSLLGFCDEGSHMILVYEGNTYNRLSLHLKNEVLTWDIRLKICLDVAHGLNYLHNEMEDQKMVIHRQLSSVCIMLDGNWQETKITGFGLSTFHENQDEVPFVDYAVKGLVDGAGLRSMAPEISKWVDEGMVFYMAKATKESDIYSFGVVMFEILCGESCTKLRANDGEFQPQHWFKDRTINQRVAEVLREENRGNKLFLKKGPNEDSLDTFIKITEQCLAVNPMQRPTLQVIIKELQKALMFQKNHKDHLRMSFEDIEAATQNFSDENSMGAGGFGRVYKGELASEHGSYTIVAKRLDTRHGQGDQQFYNELHILSEYQHENVIGLVGYNNDEQERIIVYEYASKGSLDRYLDKASLTWINRLNICIDVARGLAFLHAGVREHEAVIHRDMKPENILLFDDWKAKVAGFGFSLIYTKNEENDYVIDHVSGTRGYLDPAYQNSRFLTKESDIYSLGVILFEILYGKSTYDINKRENQFLQSLVKQRFEEGRLDEVVFDVIKNQIVPEVLATFQTIAYQCLHDDREKRPTAQDVLVQLEKALELQVKDVAVSKES